MNCTALKKVQIPSTVSKIENNSFSGCTGLTEIEVAAANYRFFSLDGVLFQKYDVVTTGIVPSLEKVFYLLKYPAGKKGAYVIPDGVTSIYPDAFCDCAGLTDIAIPSSVTTIGWEAFLGCTGLKSVTVPASVTRVGNGAFSNCTALDTCYFLGDAPQEAEGAFWLNWNEDSCAKNEHVTVCFLKGANGWSAPSWNAYHSKVFTLDGHQHNYISNVVEPTCTEASYNRYACTRCGDRYSAPLKPPVGPLRHDWNEGEPTIDDTILYTCKRCFATYEKSTNPSVILAGFKDLPAEGNWARAGIEFAVKNGLFDGTSATTFSPNGNMTRAMLVTVLWRYAGKPTGYSNTFSDVKTGAWYTNATAWAAEEEIFKGVGNNKFNPNGNVTREQMVLILFRYTQSCGINTDKRGSMSGYPDNAMVSSWAKDALEWAVAEGLINGVSGKLMPQGSATRAGCYHSDAVHTECYKVSHYKRGLQKFFAAPVICVLFHSYKNGGIT